MKILKRLLLLLCVCMCTKSIATHTRTYTLTPTHIYIHWHTHTLAQILAYTYTATHIGTQTLPPLSSRVEHTVRGDAGSIPAVGIDLKNKKFKKK